MKTRKTFIIGGSVIRILAVVLCRADTETRWETDESEPTESSNTTVVIDEPVRNAEHRNKQH